MPFPTGSDADSNAASFPEVDLFMEWLREGELLLSEPPISLF